MDLLFLGWSAEWAAAFSAYALRGFVPGRVAVEDKHAYLVLTADGSRSAIIPGRMLHRSVSRAEHPKVGDWVALRPAAEAGLWLIEAVLPRRTRLIRKVAGRTMEEQVLGTNVDLAFVVMGLDPSFNLRRLERFLVMVREGGAIPVVVLNKADLEPSGGAYRAEAERVAGGAEVRVVSALTGEGMEELRELVCWGQTVALIGTSGVGKSSLINRLYGEEIQPTLEVRESDAKGRHSTTWRELIPLPCGGVVIDTPGMREFHLWSGQEGLEEVFPDVETLALGCHFRSCSHTNEKRCAVVLAVGEGRLLRDRYQAYLKLKAEMAYLARERREHTFQGRRTRRPTRPDRWAGGVELGEA